MGGTIWSIDTFTGYEGVVGPPVDDLGCVALVTQTDGWRTTAAPRVDVTDRPARDGSRSGKSTQPGRTVTIQGKVKAPGEIALLTWIDRFKALLSDDDTDRTGTLTVAEPHLTRYQAFRRGAEMVAVPLSTTEGTFSMILWADDPRQFGTPLTASTGLPQVTGGLQLPFTLPFTLNSTVATGQVSLVNPGEAPGPVSIRMWGPVIGASQIVHVGSGLTLVFASALSLADGQWLDIDMENEEVLANGQVERAEFVTSPGWSRFDRGANTWAFAAETFTNARIDITATPAW